MNTEAKLVALVRHVDVWMENVVGQKDFHQVSPGTSGTTSGNSETLKIVHSGYCAHLEGAVGDELWSRVVLALKVLMATPHFRSFWESERANYPEDFRDFVSNVK